MSIEVDGTEKLNSMEESEAGDVTDIPVKDVGDEEKIVAEEGIDTFVNVQDEEKTEAEDVTDTPGVDVDDEEKTDDSTVDGGVAASTPFKEGDRGPNLGGSPRSGPLETDFPFMKACFDNDTCDPFGVVEDSKRKQEAAAGLDPKIPKLDISADDESQEEQDKLQNVETGTSGHDQAVFQEEDKIDLASMEENDHGGGALHKDSTE